MRPYTIALVPVVVSIILVALLLHSKLPARHQPGPLRRGWRFVLGPFPLSIALHTAALLFLIITVHQSRGRDLMMVNLVAGGGGGSGSEIDNLDMPEIPPPDVSPQFESAAITDEGLKFASLAGGYVRSENGIGIGRGGGLGTGYGAGIGSGFGGFIGRIRRTGLDVVLVIDGTDSMRLIMDEVKARMTQISRAIHRLVPTARIGIVVYGGEGEPIDVQPLTMSSTKLESFLDALRTKGGGEWEENLPGAIHTAVDQMDWKPEARKVIVLVGDAPPKADQFGSVLDLARQFHRRNGMLNAIDVTMQEHERFERAFWLRVYGEEPTRISPLPAFSQQTRNAYRQIAQAGGGSMKSLQGDDRVNKQVLMLAFGDNWAAEVNRFASAK